MGVGELHFFKSEDMKYFGKLTDGIDKSDITVEELKEGKIMRLLLKVKNGTPPMRKPCAATAYTKRSSLRCYRAVQPDASPIHGARFGGSGAPSTRQSH